jgi:hypothetical protein
MFSNNPNIIKYADEIYLYKNFISKEDVEYINKLMQPNIDNDDLLKTDINAVDWYNDKQGPQMPELIKIWDKISEFMYPEFIIHPQQNLTALRPKDPGMFVHNDNPGRGMDHLLTQDDRWHTCTKLVYGLCSYFGDFEGGEIFYPNINKDGSLANKESEDCLVVSVGPGDLVIHWAEAPYEHGVKPVRNGVRYVYSNFAIKTEEHPGTFPIWNTKEDLERKATGTWMDVVCDEHDHWEI